MGRLKKPKYLCIWFFLSQYLRFKWKNSSREIRVIDHLLLIKSKYLSDFYKIVVSNVWNEKGWTVSGFQKPDVM